MSGKGSTLILGRSFFMTARTKIDVHFGTLSMELSDNLVQFNIFKVMKHPTEDHSLFSIDIINNLVDELFEVCLPGRPPAIPVIIANNLHWEQEEKLLNILGKHKKAIGLMLSDHLELTPPSHRGLNSTILDVVKKKVTKLLPARVIYPISDNQWVSTVQVVPKKSR
ncbi:hypothetical protein CR513_23408, partial [Mucuna pruriens]